MVELMKGEMELPWDELGYTDDRYESLHLLLKSPRFPAHHLLNGMPEELFAIRLHLLGLYFEDVPDYLFLFDQLSNILKRCPNARPNQPLPNY